MTETGRDSTTTTRRGFVGRIWAWLAGLVAVEAVWVGWSILRPRKAVERDADGVVVAGPVDRFEPGSVTAFPEGRFYLSRLGDGSFLALSRRCTHLGCTVPWVGEEERFVCPCHASAFDRKGEVLSAPAPRALDLFPVRIENGVVKIDTGTTIARRSFASAQAVQP